VAFAVALIGAAPTGGVYVTTLPSGADVWVDGTYLGRSPIVIDALGAGAHRFTITETGWTSQDVPVTIVAATTTTASVVLAREGKQADAGGTIAIHGAHVGSLSVDGEPVRVGNDGTFAVSAGTHDVTMVLPHGKATRTVTVYPQTRTDIVVAGDVPEHSVVIAPADDYLPPSSLKIDGNVITIHTSSHDVVAHLGSLDYTVDRRAVSFDSPPTVIKNRVYLPIELLTMIATSGAK
jgi:hypothetical protein